MNERIQALAEQATVYHSGGLGTEIESFDKEKFAQLIVRECANLADEAEPFLASDLIKQHFGVDK